MTARRQERLDDVLTYIGLGLVFLFFGLPLLWVLSLAFRNAQEILVSTVNPIPDNPTLDNFSEVLSSAQFPRFLMNSALLSAIGAFGACSSRLRPRTRSRAWTSTAARHCCSACSRCR